MTTEYWPVYWEDRGCHVSPSCLRCPLPECVEDNPRALVEHQLERRRQSDQGIAAIVRAEGLKAPEAAERFHTSERRIYRILARTKG